MALSAVVGHLPLVVVISGPGGAGKGTITRAIVAADPNLVLSVSWTTRRRRIDDVEDAYVFVDQEVFERRRTERGFVEWNEFLGCLYGTPTPDPGDHRDLLLEIDVAGGRQVLDRYPDALCVFVDASNATLRRRLLARGEGTERVDERLSEANRERIEATDLGYQFVTNEDLGSAVAAVAEMIAAHRE